MASSSAGNLIIDGAIQIVTAHISRNPIDGDKVPDLIRSVGLALTECVEQAMKVLGETPEIVAPAPVAAAPVAAAPVASAPKPAQPKAAVSEVVSEFKAAAPVVDAPRPVAEVPAPMPAASQAAPVGIRARRPDLPTEPKVPIDQSVTSDAVICLFDGEPRKMLHRHIRSKYNMTPEEYREFWNLPADYPMTAPGYSQEKRIVAVAQGLGTPKLYENAKKNKAAENAPAAKATGKRGRKTA